MTEDYEDERLCTRLFKFLVGLPMLVFIVAFIAVPLKVYLVAREYYRKLKRRWFDD